jgi:uncharacterized membrane protein
MEWLIARPTVIGIAVAGGVFSLAAMLLKNKPGRAKLVWRLNMTSYLLMGASMLLFIVAGLRVNA